MERENAEFSHFIPDPDENCDLGMARFTHLGRVDKPATEEEPQIVRAIIQTPRSIQRAHSPSSAVQIATVQIQRIKRTATHRDERLFRAGRCFIGGLVRIGLRVLGFEDLVHAEARVPRFKAARSFGKVGA